ncbi:MAG: hypothetical protein QW505_02940 [Thermoplasmata archaeon]
MRVVFSAYEEKGAIPFRALAISILILLLFLLPSSLLIALSVQSDSSDGFDAPTATIMLGTESSGPVIFHLHWDGTTGAPDPSDYMNTSGPYSPGTLDYDSDGVWGITIRRVPPRNYHYWTMLPNANADILIQGNVTLMVWGRARDNNSLLDFDFNLYDSIDANLGSDTTIAMASYPDINTLSNETLYVFTLSDINYTLPAGHTLIVYLGRYDNINTNFYVTFDQTFSDSICIMDIRSHYGIADGWTQGIEGTKRSVFTNREPIKIFANVTDALGAYDVSNASLRIVSEANSSVMYSSMMSVSAVDQSVLSSWKLFEHTVSPLPGGEYRIDVEARDNTGNAVSHNWTFSVIVADHFDVSVSKTRVSAGEPFNVTIEVKDGSNQRMQNWSGLISLEAIDASTWLPISGLSNASVTMSLSDSGIVSVSENLTKAPLLIRIRATNGTTSGESEPIQIVPGQIVQMWLSEYVLNMVAGDIRTISVYATDKYNNTNTSWQPYWTIAPPNATIAPYGMNATITARLAGLSTLRCQDNVTGINVTALVNISASGLSRIEVIPDSVYVLEGKTIQIRAMGYDPFDNEIDISGAVWNSEGFTLSLILGSGANGQFVGGMMPETGIIYVRLGTVQGSAQINVICPPWGPNLGAFPNQVGYEDTPWERDLALFWQDVNGTSSLSWFVTDVNTSLLIISPKSRSVVNFIPQPNAFGENTVKFWVRDGDGFTNYKIIKITVNPVNDAPEFVNNPPTKIYVKFNTPYSFNYDYYVRDVDNNKNTLTLRAELSSSKYGSITASGLVLTYLFSDALGGKEYQVTASLILSDGALQDTLSSVIFVTSDTPPELVKELPDVTIDEGQLDYEAFDLDDYFTDPDQDILYYSNGSEHVVITIDANHVVWLSSPSEWSGQEEAVFTAQDPTGAIQIDTIIITVKPVNDPPEISPINPIFVHYDDPYILDLRMYVSDPDNELVELVITTSDPVNVSYSVFPYPSLGILYPENLSGGPYTGPYEVQVILCVSDGNLSSQGTLRIIVSDNYPPRWIPPTPELLTFMEDTYLTAPYSINLISMSQDGDSSDLTFIVEGNVDILVMIGTDGWVNFSAPPDWNGNEMITFKVFDEKGAWDSFKVRVDVLPVNDPPILLPIPNQDHYGGRQWSLSLRPYIIDVDDPMLRSIEIIIESPEFVRAVGLELYFDFPEEVESITVILKVSDGEDESSTVSFTASVKKTFEEMIYYPWSLFLVLIVAALIGYLVAIRMLPHKLQELFIIHNDGRLICKVGAESIEGGMDEDVVSAMFTAIQEFIKDSFKDEPEGLKNLEIGDSKIAIEKGKWIYAAMIYKGWPPKSVFKDFRIFVRELEEAYGRDIQFWDGTMKKLFGLKAVSQAMLQKKYRPEAVKQEKLKAEAKALEEMQNLQAEKSDDRE